MRFVKFFAAAGVAALFIGSAYAQAPVLSANRNPKVVRAGTYAVEPVHTRVLFSVSHMGFTTWYGDFTSVRGAAFERKSS